MIEREEFVRYMERIRGLHDLSNGIHEALVAYDPEFGGFNNDRAVTLATDLLADLVDDPAEWIKYYMYDLDFGVKDGKVSVGGKPIPFKTYGDLYDCITAYNDLPSGDTGRVE